MILDIPVEESFLAPEGRFHGTCTAVNDECGKNGKDCVRVTFDLDPISEGVLYCVGRNFPEVKEFKVMLREWLGPASRGKRIDTKTLVGKRALLEIVHIPPKGNHAHAFRKVVRILPPEVELEQAA